MNVIDCFDVLHSSPTWRPWRAFVQAVYGAPMDADALAHFRRHTGRSEQRFVYVLSPVTRASPVIPDMSTGGS
jgi:hypothetical protein